MFRSPAPLMTGVIRPFSASTAMPMFSESKYVMVPSSSLIRALTTGWAFSAWAAAFTKNGIGDSLTPSRAAKAAFAWLRSFISLVMSTSRTEVSWACECSAFIMFSPMTLRMRVILTV